MAAVQDLLFELLLHIFPLFCLKCLIAGSGLCRGWAHLIHISDIDPSCRALLRLFRLLIHSPSFLPTHRWSLEHLQPFDRQAYVDALLTQHDGLPEDFRLWTAPR
ncbi:hypothetical protein C8J57DRAFT_1357008 [Mycena rebaudengoi]|jgi:hypothetical protein|nr:hypothetical protein C8J57DRAFT_1357008 [Mycena rebaudengoi]